MMPVKLLALFTDKGKQVSASDFRYDTRTETHNRENSLGSTGTRCVTSVSSTPHTASGHQKVSDRKIRVTIVQSKKWSAPSGCLGFQLEMVGSVRRRGVTAKE